MHMKAGVTNTALMQQSVPLVYSSVQAFDLHPVVRLGVQLSFLTRSSVHLTARNHAHSHVAQMVAM